MTTLFDLEENGKFTYKCWKCGRQRTMVGLQDTRHWKCVKCGGTKIQVRVHTMSMAQRRALCKKWGWEPVSLMHAQINLGLDGFPTASSAGTGPGATSHPT